LDQFDDLLVFSQADKDITVLESDFFIVMKLTFRAKEKRVFSNLIFDNLMKFMKILETHFCPNFTILQLFFKFHYNLAH